MPSSRLCHGQAHREQSVSAQFFITAPLPPEPVAPKITTSASKHYSCTFNISKAKRGIGRDPWGAPNIHCFSTATCRAPTSSNIKFSLLPAAFSAALTRRAIVTAVAADARLTKISASDRQCLPSSRLL